MSEGAGCLLLIGARDGGGGILWLVARKEDVRTLFDDKGVLVLEREARQRVCASRTPHARRSNSQRAWRGERLCGSFLFSYCSMHRERRRRQRGEEGDQEQLVPGAATQVAAPEYRASRRA